MRHFLTNFKKQIFHRQINEWRESREEWGGVHIYKKNFKLYLFIMILEKRENIETLSIFSLKKVLNISDAFVKKSTHVSMIFDYLLYNYHVEYWIYYTEMCKNEKK